jgi:hypothetical protein
MPHLLIPHLLQSPLAVDLGESYLMTTYLGITQD